MVNGDQAGYPQSGKCDDEGKKKTMEKYRALALLAGTSLLKFGWLILPLIVRHDPGRGKNHTLRERSKVAETLNQSKRLVSDMKLFDFA